MLCSPCLVANIAQSVRGIYWACKTCNDGYDLCFKCYRSIAILHPEHTMEERGSEEIIHSSPVVSVSESKSPVASESSDDEIVDLETVVATVQGRQADEA